MQIIDNFFLKWEPEQINEKSDCKLEQQVEQYSDSDSDDWAMELLDLEDMSNYSEGDDCCSPEDISMQDVITRSSSSDKSMSPSLYSYVQTQLALKAIEDEYQKNRFNAELSNIDSRNCLQPIELGRGIDPSNEGVIVQSLKKVDSTPRSVPTITITSPDALSPRPLIMDSPILEAYVKPQTSWPNIEVDRHLLTVRAIQRQQCLRSRDAHNKRIDPGSERKIITTMRQLRHDLVCEILNKALCYKPQLPQKTPKDGLKVRFAEEEMQGANSNPDCSQNIVIKTIMRRISKYIKIPQDYDSEHTFSLSTTSKLLGYPLPWDSLLKGKKFPSRIDCIVDGANYLTLMDNVDNLYNPLFTRCLPPNYNLEAFCEWCGKWISKRNKSYAHHMKNIHGISELTGTMFKCPEKIRGDDPTNFHGLCDNCYQWVPLSMGNQSPWLNWYAHQYLRQTKGSCEDYSGERVGRKCKNRAEH